MTEVETTDIPPLNWDVFMTPGIPIVTSDMPPGVKEVQFQAMASTYAFNPIIIGFKRFPAPLNIFKN